MGNQLGFCPGPLPGSPFPRILNPLSPRLKYTDGRREIEYLDRHGFLEAIEDKEALCDASGCRCHGPILTCGHTDGPFYEPLFAQAYAAMCFHTCHCDLLPSAIGDGVPIDVGNVQVIDIKQDGNIDDEQTRLEATALGKNGCLKGKYAGWTLERYASQSCCPETQFQALTPQEAYMNYKVAPTLSELITGSVTIGICL